MRRLAHALLAAASVLAVGAASAETRQEDAFNTMSFSADDLGPVPQWREVLERIGKDERPVWLACDEKNECGSMKMVAWRSQIASAKALPPERQLFEINRFANDLSSFAGMEPPKAGESWPGVLEALDGKGGAIGRAILKYQTLRESGFPSGDLRIVMGMDTLNGGETAFVLARIGADFYVLDPLYPNLREAGSARNLFPHYSFNEKTLWIHLPRQQEVAP